MEPMRSTERLSGSCNNTTDSLAGACANQYNRYNEYSECQYNQNMVERGKQIILNRRITRVLGIMVWRMEMQI